MAAVTIQTTLRNYQAQALTGLAPEMWFIPSGPAVTTSGTYAPDIVKITPEMYGAVTVDLETTDDKRPEMWYLVKVIWLWPDGSYSHEEYIPGRLYVPAGGGYLGDLMQSPWNPVLAWWGPGDPPEGAVPNALALNTLTGILSIWSN